jgi:hypothetical protein
MKKKKRIGKYLKFYFECLERRVLLDEPEMEGPGLCCNRTDGKFLSDDERVELFCPNSSNHNYSTWWGSRLNSGRLDKKYGHKYRFNDFRKNVVLFLAAMTGESC